MEKVPQTSAWHIGRLSVLTVLGLRNHPGISFDATCNNIEFYTARCVSGTPIQRGLEDLYGLLKFLKAEPFDSRFWWNHALQGPYEVRPVSNLSPFTFLSLVHLLEGTDLHAPQDGLHVPEEKDSELHVCWKTVAYTADGRSLCGISMLEGRFSRLKSVRGSLELATQCLKSLNVLPFVWFDCANHTNLWLRAKFGWWFLDSLAHLDNGSRRT
jgi:hypothetical protein